VAKKSKISTDGEPGGHGDKILSYCQSLCPWRVSGGVFLQCSINELSSLYNKDDLLIASKSSPFL